MASVFSEVSIKGLRKAHFKQLMSYIEKRDHDNWHSGDYKQFMKRHKEIKTWVQGIIDEAEEHGVIIPKKITA